MDELHDQQTENTIPQEEQTPPAYVPRPKWQVLAARVGLVVFVIILILYYGIMFFGGGR